MDAKKKIIEFCMACGLDVIGFSECRIYHELSPYFNERKKLGFVNEFEEQDVDKRINPFIYMPEGKTIITIAFPYLYNLDFSNKVNFSSYTLGRDYHIVTSEYLGKICEFIKGLGANSIQLVDSNALPERYIAKLAGVGFIGKNNTLITKKYGSYVFLGEIITDLIIEPGIPIKQKCGDCEICLKACPTRSITKGKVGINNNSNICLSYITQKKDIEDYWFDKLGGRLFGCDTCQRACPCNDKVEFSTIEELKPYEHMKEIELKNIISIDNKLFKDKYKITSCGWRGKNIIKRNAIINAINTRKRKILDVNKDTSPYIRDYYYRLLKHFKL